MNKTWMLTALVLVVIAGGSYGLFSYLSPRPLPTQLLYANGHIEGTEVRLAAEVPGQVVSSNLVEGRSVQKGDVLLEIDSTELTLEKERVDAQIAALAAQRRRAQSELDTANHHQTTANRELDRVRELKNRGTATPQQLDAAENAFEEAQGHVNELAAEIAAVDAQTEAARRQMETIEYRISKTRLTAPADGTVLVKGLEQGEYAQPGQTAAVLVNLARMDLRVFIPESDLAKIKLGDQARIRVDAFPDRLFDARVARVDESAQFTPRDIHMPDERVRTVFGVVLRVDNPEGELKPGMPADAWILWQPDAGWPQHLFVPG